MSSLIKQNILIARSTLGYINETLIKVKYNEQKLNEAIDNLSINIKKLSATTNGLSVMFNVYEILNSLEIAVLTLSFQLEDINNAILFSSQSVLHPAIITPKALYRELVDNYRYIAPDAKLPIK